MKSTFSPNRVAQIVGVPRDQVLRWEDEGTLSPDRNHRNERIFSSEDVRKALEMTGRRIRKRFSVVNQKGGVGKTTTAFNLAAALVLEGRRVLLIDLDAQASLTVSFGLDPESFGRTSHDLLVNDETTAAESIVATKHEGLDLIPADIRLASADVLLREMIMRERILLTKLEPILDRYDFVLFDCPPNLSTITINALVASTGAIVPMETQFYSIKAVDDLSKTFHVLSSRMRHDLEVWMLPMKIDRRVKSSMECLARMEESFAGRLLTPIRTDANLMKAPLAHEPAVMAFAASRGAKDYRRIARELLEVKAE
ncbi:MAG: AAA family ATPase [Planctomycetota bacterium]